jgi:hypothetical protein
MKRPEVVAKHTGENNWRNRPENKKRASEYKKRQSKERCRSGNPMWKGGRTIDAEGYVRILVDGKYYLEHRLIMEKHLKRFLLPEEVIHHRNHDKQDNRIENFELTTQSDHVAYHNHEQWIGRQEALEKSQKDRESKS